MNIHPLVVHFPIALLTIYSILECIRFGKVKGLSYWFYIKASFVIFGGLGILGALFTGNIASEIALKDASLRPVLEMHESFADLTAAVFGIVAFCYLVAFLEKSGFFVFPENSFLTKLWNIILKIKHLVIETPLVVFMAVLGLVFITITGSLGGFIVYGENTDPVIKIVYHLFF